jgi:SNF2 family DNA or RNA helicase
MYRIYTYTKIIKGIENIFTVIDVNTKRLEKYVRNNKPIPYVNFLKNLCKFHILYSNYEKIISNRFYDSPNIKTIDGNIKFIIKKAQESADYILDDEIEPMKEINLKLYKYQKCSIYWMLQKERNHKSIQYSINDEVKLGNVYYDFVKQKFFHKDNRKQLTFQGGGLIDEVGLGKTIMITALSILNNSNDTSYIRDTDNSKLFSRATLIICPSQLCGQWIRELNSKISKDYNPNIISIMTKKQYSSYTYNDLLDADFVIVSSTFFDNEAFYSQWTPKISYVKSYHKKRWESSDYNNIDTLFQTMGKKLVSNPIDTLELNKPLLQLIHWHRLVIDEFHEVHSINKYRPLANLLYFIKSTHRWVVTATPFINDDSLLNTIDFLTSYDNNDGQLIFNNPDIVEYLSTNCFRRNTKHSVKNEHKLPPLINEIIWLKFTATERMMYNAYLADPNNNKFSVYLRQLCCHPQLADETKLALSNCKSLQDIEKMMITHYKLQVDMAQDKVDRLINRINKWKIKKEKLSKKKNKMIRIDPEGEDPEGKNLIDENMEISIDNIIEIIQELEIRLSTAEKELEGKTTTFNFYNNVVDRLRKTVNKNGDTNHLQNRINYNNNLDNDTNIMNLISEDINDPNNDDEKCGICMDVIPEDDVGVTKCGHIFCYECLKTSIVMYKNCPMCRKQLNNNDIFILSFERQNKIDKNTDEKDLLINTVGTKLANLILFLKNSKEHTIIFSQWDDLLNRVGSILSKYDIKNVFCKGNCFRRDKAIRQFNGNDDIRVIMLSSDSAASGTNLTKATQVIFLDPIYGKYKFRKEQERQAIGRAHRLGQNNKIKVIRLIIKDSVEEEIYWMNFNEDKKYQ